MLKIDAGAGPEGDLMTFVDSFVRKNATIKGDGIGGRVVEVEGGAFEGKLKVGIDGIVVAGTNEPLFGKGLVVKSKRDMGALFFDGATFRGPLKFTSGVGRDRGKWGIEAYSELQAISWIG